MTSSTRGSERLKRSVWFRLEFLRALLLSRLGGVEWVIRYLRNPNPGVSAHLLRHFHAEIGPQTTFKRALYFDNVYEDQASAGDFSRLRMGSNCYLGDEVYFDLSEGVRLGDNVVVAGRASFLTHADCNRSPALAEQFPRRRGPVEIGNDVWIGFGATILCGVRIGDFSVVAAGAVVTENLPGAALYAGAPAKLVRALVRKESAKAVGEMNPLAPQRE